MARLASSTLWVVAAFAAARLLAWLAGVRFDLHHLDWAWQLLDLAALRSDYWGSLWHMHSQPPLFNALVGAALKGFGGHAGTALHALYVAGGLAFALAGHRLLVRLEVQPALAAALVIAFVVSPAALLYEHWLMYTHLEAVLLGLAAWALHGFVRAGRLGWGLAFFGALAALCLLRSLYHLGYLLLVVGALLAWAPHAGMRRRTILLAALVPVLLVTALYAKNAVLFGSFGASSWLGMSVYKVSVVQLGPEAIARMQADGRLSALASLGPFQPLEAYPAAYTRLAPTGVPVLDAAAKAGGAPNFNHRAYIGVSRQFLRDGLQALRAEPGVVPKALAQSLLVYARPASAYGFLGPNRQPLAAWETLYDKAVYGRWLPEAWRRGSAAPADRIARLKAELAEVGLVLAVAFPLLVGFGLVSAWRRRGEPAWAIPTLFMTLTIVYVTLVGNGLEIGENNRFRYAVDFYYLALAALAIEAGRRRWLKASGRPS